MESYVAWIGESQDGVAGQGKISNYWVASTLATTGISGFVIRFRRFGEVDSSQSTFSYKDTLFGLVVRCNAHICSYSK